MQSLDQDWKKARKLLADIRSERRKARETARDLLNEGLRSKIFNLIRLKGEIQPDELQEILENKLDTDSDVAHALVQDALNSIAVETRTVLALDDERLEELQERGSSLVKHEEVWEELDYLPDP